MTTDTPSPKRRPNLSVVAGAIASAEPVELEAPAPEMPAAATPLDPPPGEENAHGVGPGKWLPNRLGLPDDCPVKPLGFDGDVYWFLDTCGQLRRLAAKDFGQKTLTALFMGRHHYLYWGWPRQNVRGEVVSWRAEKVAEDLMAACAAKGPWSDVERVRGRGAWRTSKGQLIIHTGTELVLEGRSVPTGEFGRYVYPVRPPIPRPWHGRIDEEGNPAKELVPLFRRWNWARPGVDPVLLLGWIGAAYLGGALATRPIVFLTGDKGTGKSMLQKILKGLFGDWLLQSTNTTAAGLYQRVGQDSVPIAVDEFEGSANNARAKAIVELARQAYSGGLMHRGGDRHQGTSFIACNAYLFSSINSPPLEPQDVSRMAFLRLHQLSGEQPPPDIDEDTLARLGSMVLRRLVDQWHRFGATFDAYCAELREAGHDGRGQATYGTLLACADLIVGEEFDADEIKLPMGEDLSYWREAMRAEAMAEYEDAVANWRLCLSHLLTAPVEAWRGGARLTVGRVLEAFFFGKDTDGEDAQLTFAQARAQLELAGLGLMKPDQANGGHWLAVPNQNPMLQRLFAGTKWQGEPGSGVWSPALRQGPRGTLWDVRSLRINGDKAKCTVISLKALYGPGGLMATDDISSN